MNRCPDCGWTLPRFGCPYGSRCNGIALHMRNRTFYIEVRRPNGRLEYFDYRCETEAQARAYAQDKARSYGGSVATCRCWLDERVRS